MCGIAGISSRNFDKECEEKCKLMASLLDHRGPDDSGYQEFQSDGKTVIETASTLYIAAENNSADSITALKNTGYDFNTDPGNQEFQSDGQTVKETTSALYIAAQKDSAASITALNDTLYNFYKNYDMTIIIH